jgi:hypothetical protein
MNRQNAASLLQPLAYCRTDLCPPEGLHNEIRKYYILPRAEMLSEMAERWLNISERRLRSLKA